MNSSTVILLYPFLLSGNDTPETENGQGLVEYALILVLVAVVVVAILTILGPQIGSMFSEINSAIPT